MAKSVETLREQIETKFTAADSAVGAWLWHHGPTAPADFEKSPFMDDFNGTKNTARAAIQRLLGLGWIHVDDDLKLVVDKEGARRMVQKHIETIDEVGAAVYGKYTTLVPFRAFVASLADLLGSAERDGFAMITIRDEVDYDWRNWKIEGWRWETDEEVERREVAAVNTKKAKLEKLRKQRQKLEKQIANLEAP